MHKRYLIGVILIFTVFSLRAQDSIKHWKTGGLAALNFNQLSLTNWAAGGSSSVSGTALFNFTANYAKEKNAWENTLNLTYGQLKRNGEKPVKSDDKMEFASKFGRKATNAFFYTLLFGFRSQFAPGYKSPQDKEIISNFLAPAYINLALGMDYKPAEGFSFYLSPVSGRITIVKDDSLSAKGAFGVDPGKKVRYEFGGYAKAAVNKNIMENVNLQTSVDLFSNYIKNPENVDVNWQILLGMKINKYLSANISSQLIYDDDIKIGKDENNDGTIDPSEKKPRIQFKEAFAIGLAYKF
ncbi:MAG TPA: DUF3078 domain-containing protein [Bacteroidales bacterium]|nr:DUF3078 domain-containing protein [Bacteroidales bacterium]